MAVLVYSLLLLFTCTDWLVMASGFSPIVRLTSAVKSLSHRNSVWVSQSLWTSDNALSMEEGCCDWQWLQFRLFSAFDSVLYRALSACKQVFLSFSLQQGFPAVSIYYLTVALYMYVISVFSISWRRVLENRCVCHGHSIQANFFLSSCEAL